MLPKKMLYGAVVIVLVFVLDMIRAFKRGRTSPRGNTLKK